MSAPVPARFAWRSAGAAFLTGALFAVGLVVSGMTQPSKVLGFLDVAGAWDPSLAFVMLGAISVHFVTRRLILRRAAPLAAAAFHEPKRAPVDAPLVVGAAIFGIGWGGSGYCPGPSLVTLGAGSLDAVIFVLAMVGGMAVHRVLRPHLAAGAARDHVAQPASLVPPAQADG
jgi:uncharacterized protein